MSIDMRRAEPAPTNRSGTRKTFVSSTPPSVPRLRLPSTSSHRAHLDGAWWPRSTDPVAELPGLVLAIDAIRGPITRLVLAADGWAEHPRRLGVADRVLRLGYFHSQPTSLLTALCANGDRVDLLVVAPDADEETAEAAMILATAIDNLVPVQQIVAPVSTRANRPLSHPAELAWETEGGAGSARMSPVSPVFDADPALGSST